MAICARFPCARTFHLVLDAHSWAPHEGRHHSLAVRDHIYQRRGFGPLAVLLVPLLEQPRVPEDCRGLRQEGGRGRMRLDLFKADGA